MSERGKEGGWGGKRVCSPPCPPPSAILPVLHPQQQLDENSPLGDLLGGVLDVPSCQIGECQGGTEEREVSQLCCVMFAYLFCKDLSSLAYMWSSLSSRLLRALGLLGTGQAGSGLQLSATSVLPRGRCAPSGSSHLGTSGHTARKMQEWEEDAGMGGRGHTKTP